MWAGIQLCRGRPWRKCEILVLDRHVIAGAFALDGGATTLINPIEKAVNRVYSAKSAWKFTRTIHVKRALAGIGRWT